MIQIGSLDRVTAIVGERGMGKSTLVWLDALDFQRETGGYVVGHSPRGQIGDRPQIVFYDRMDGFLGLERGLRRHPEMQHFLVSRRPGAPEEILSFALSLSTAVRKAAHQREWIRFRDDRPAPKGLLAPPVLAIVDEGTSMPIRPGKEELARLQTMLVNARHSHLAVTWSIQSPTARSWILMEQSNRIRVFRYMHEWGANALRAAGIPREVVYDLGDLPRFSYLEFDKGVEDGPRARYRVLPDP